ncbi:TetR/AcrR family transcriptional regulator [Nocardia sp. XZ_19_369]|uniref:TetR/AcrR family transcriptional regulator n=1 Tax=Nocardia sp. XZ_19_369 TaxID=2769487 RepID=UPI00188E7DD7|nr:TetR/AcrR family transcriptional regulator [Nocardia sp. XZ_19_369]
MRRAEIREHNRAALITAAITEIAAHGYQSARLGDIADRAGLTTGAIYSIFGSKQALLFAAIHRIVAEHHDTFRPLTDPDLPLNEVLRGYAAAVLDAAAENRAREYFAFELEAMAATLRDPQLRSDVDEQVPSNLDLLKELLTDHPIDQADGPRTTAAQVARLAPAVHALMSGFAQHAIVEPAGVDRDYVNESLIALLTLVE